MAKKPSSDSRPSQKPSRKTATRAKTTAKILPARLAAGIEQARVDLRRARHALARHGELVGASVVVGPRWAWVHRLIDARRASLLQIPGVIGCGLGQRVRAGKVEREPVVAVFVRKKLTPRELEQSKVRRIPRRLSSRGRSIGVDVVAFGQLHRHALVGEGIGPMGTTIKGTIGGRGELLGASRPVAIMAMHVTGHREYPAAGVTPIQIGYPSPRDSPAPRVIGTVAVGTVTGVDAARVDLVSEAAVSPQILQIGRIRGPRPIADPGDRGIPVQIFGAMSGRQHGVIRYPWVPIPADSLDAAIVVEIPCQEGDSGCPLLDFDNYLLGFLVGEGSGSIQGLQVFTPASLVLPRLSVRIPLTSEDS